MKKKHIICFLTCVAVILIAYFFHMFFATRERHIKVGFVFIGDEMTPHTNNFIAAKNHILDVYGDMVECVCVYNMPEEKVERSVLELIDAKCDFIVAPSYGYASVIKEIAQRYPDIQFCVPTANNANESPVLENYHNCFASIYEGRYVCGVVAGLKLKEMIDSGLVTKDDAKIGFVAAFPLPEVISGYTAFYMGVNSVVPEARMFVKYTDTWSSYSLEKQAAQELIDRGCLIISQHSDTVGPAIACENTKDKQVYHVGYNQSMTNIAPTRSLVSCTIDYTYYFEQALNALIHGKKIEDYIDGKTYGQDAMAGLKKGWVRILDINQAVVAKDTQQVVKDVIEKIKSDKIEIFSGPFTGTNIYDINDKIDLRTPYHENEKSSSPTFSYILDDVIVIIPDNER